MATRQCAPAPRSPQRAFTLIEMLLVLALLALLSALVAPQMARWATASAQRQGVQSVRQQIESWSQTAFLAGAAATWPAATASGTAGRDARVLSLPMDLPEGWQLQARPVVVLASNGMVEQCARLTLVDDQARLLADWRCEGPALRLRDAVPGESDDGAPAQR